MNVTEADLKEIYFKQQDIFPFYKYLNHLNEYYNTLEELKNTELKRRGFKPCWTILFFRMTR